MCKHVKKIRSSQGFSLTNSCTELSFSPWVSLMCWGWLSLLNQIGALTLSILLNLSPRKLEPWFVLWSFFLLRLLCISINLPYGHAWNTAVMSRLVLLAATWNSWCLTGFLVPPKNQIPPCSFLSPNVIILDKSPMNR